MVSSPLESVHDRLHTLAIIILNTQSYLRKLGYLQNMTLLLPIKDKKSPFLSVELLGK